MNDLMDHIISCSVNYIFTAFYCGLDMFFIVMHQFQLSIQRSQSADLSIVFFFYLNQTNNGSDAASEFVSSTKENRLYLQQ